MFLQENIIATIIYNTATMSWSLFGYNIILRFYGFLTFKVFCDFSFTEKFYFKICVIGRTNLYKYSKYQGKLSLSKLFAYFNSFFIANFLHEWTLLLLIWRVSFTVSRRNYNSSATWDDGLNQKMTFQGYH